MDRLDAFFEQHALKPWQPGVVDCCLALADWAMECGYSDPAAHLRGTYDSDEGFQQIIEAAGSVSALVSSCAARVGLQPCREPARCSIGVIGSPTNIHRQFGAIHDGERWQVRFAQGIGPMAAKPLAIWML